MNLKDFVSHPLTMRLGMVLSRHLPEGLVDRLAWWFAGAACGLKPEVYRIARANLAQVLGPGAESAVLERTTRQALQALLQSSVALYRAVDQPYEAAVASVDFPEATLAVARTLRESKTGSIVVFPHLGSFDLGGLALAAHVPPIQVLSLPDPPPGFELSNELRRAAGNRVTPLSPAALREAIRHLRSGGVVGVAGDRPVSELDPAVPFFGRPARLPSGHVRLALRTGALLVIAYCILSPETRKPTFYLEPPLELVRSGDREEAVQANLRRVLDALEAVIGRWPGQWQMFVPVWPEPAPRQQSR